MTYFNAANFFICSTISTFIFHKFFTSFQIVFSKFLGSKFFGHYRYSLYRIGFSIVLILIFSSKICARRLFLSMPKKIKMVTRKLHIVIKKLEFYSENRRHMLKARTKIFEMSGDELEFSFNIDAIAKFVGSSISFFIGNATSQQPTRIFSS